jgi:hypothetical protein
MLNILIYIVLILIIGVLIFIITKQQVKNNKYETTLISIYDDLIEIITEVNTIDQAGMFESDDDVGIIFKQIHSLINDLTKYLIIDNTEE